MLLEAIGNRRRQKTRHGIMHLQSAQGRQRAKLFAIGAVLNEQACEDGGWDIELKMAETDLQRFLRQENLEDNLLQPLPVPATAVTN